MVTATRPPRAFMCVYTHALGGFKVAERFGNVSKVSQPGKKQDAVRCVEWFILAGSEMPLYRQRLRSPPVYRPGQEEKEATRLLL